MAQSLSGVGKQGLLVVVWEFQNYQGRWRPYSSGVTQYLERAYSKNLHSVNLGDADSGLKGLTVVLSDMKQINGDSDAEKVNVRETPVRRQFYPHSSPAGQGSVWQWAGETPGDWITYDMCVQIILEEAWTSGAQAVDLGDHSPRCPYTVDFCNLTQVNKKSMCIRSIRRANQAAYPIARPDTPLQSNNFGRRMSPSMGPSPRGPSHSSVGWDHSKRRCSKEDLEAAKSSKSEGGARSLLNKVGDLLHLGNNHNSHDTTKPPNHSKQNTQHESLSHNKSNHNRQSDLLGTKLNGHHRRHHYHGGAERDKMTGGRSSAFAQENGAMSLQPSQPPDTGPPQSSRRGARPPVPKPRTRFPLRDNSLAYQSMPQTSHSRMDSGEEQFGSNVTLNSDCSSMSHRRPSVETISTYLSQDSFNDEYNSANSYEPERTSSSSRVDNLIHLDDSMDDDDDVFSADQEVRDVFMQKDDFSSSSTGDSSSQHSQSHFMPINSPTDSEPMMEGVKRKRPIGNRSSNASVDSTNSHHRPDNNNYFSNFKLRKPQNDNERILVAHTHKVLHPPNADCSICMGNFSEDPGFDADPRKGFLVSPVVSTSKCKHLFHEHCLEQLLVHSLSTTIFLKCPNCNTIHGEKWGNQPSGTMTVHTVNGTLPGFSKCRTVQISYNIPSGIQGKEHPNPGRKYHPIGFPRVAYLPDNDKGQKVLKLLRIAFDRRLIFTVGTSVTTNMSDCVTWNEIHHKTQWHNHSGHGYPDPAYLDNVLEELKSHGVFE